MAKHFFPGSDSQTANAFVRLLSVPDKKGFVLTDTLAQTPDRLEILSLISGQAASTIEKARLVQDLKSANEDLKRSQTELEGYNRNLEGKVADRTLELSHKNDLLVAEVAEKQRAQAEMRSAKDVAESATNMKSQFLGSSIKVGEVSFPN